MIFRSNQKKYDINALCEVVMISCNREFEQKAKFYIKNMLSLLNTIPKSETEEEREITRVSFERKSPKPLPIEEVLANGQTQNPYFYSRRSVK